MLNIQGDQETSTKKIAKGDCDSLLTIARRENVRRFPLQFRDNGREINMKVNESAS